MQRVLVAEVGSVIVEDAAVPDPGSGEVRVTMLRAGICGSDTHAAAGQHPLLPPPYHPGHEAVGTVSALGAGVTGLTVGQRVILKPNVTCGTCVNCAAGRGNACQSLEWVGCDPSGRRPGAMAEEFIAPADNLLPVPDALSDDEAVLIECLGTPTHAARLVRDELPRGRVLVIGAGTIGLLAVIVAARAGARVVVSDLDPGKRERALRHGADAAVDPAGEDFTAQVTGALDGPADVVFDCVANARSAAQAIDALRRAGTLLVVGVPAGDFALPMALVQDHEMRIQGCANYTTEDLQAAIETALDGGLPAGEIISEALPLSRAREAFDHAGAHTSGKVVLIPDA